MDKPRYKGLQNKGENNCFINSVVQVLWSLKDLRSQLILSSHTHKTQSSCISCEISTLFTQMTYSENSSFSTFGLRKALSYHLAHSSKFDELSMGCAVEAFETILSYLHNDYATFYACNDDCPSHRHFNIHFYEESLCCKFLNNEIKSEFLIRIYSRDLEEIFNIGKRTGGMNNEFGEILASVLNSVEDGGICENCGQDLKRIRSLANLPRVLNISLVWDPDGWKFFSVLLESLRPIMKFGPDEKSFILKGIVCFSFSHYLSFVYEIDENTWYQLDDHLVIKMKSFCSIIQLMIRKKCIPVIFVYEFLSENYQILYDRNKDMEMFEDINHLDCFNCSML